MLDQLEIGMCIKLYYKILLIYFELLLLTTTSQQHYNYIKYQSQLHKITFKTITHSIKYYIKIALLKTLTIKHIISNITYNLF